MSDRPTTKRKWKLQYNMRHLFLATALVACVLGVWCGYVRKPVSITAPKTGDISHEERLGFAGPASYYDTSPEELSLRTVLVATGRFSAHTPLHADLYLVEAGEICELNSVTAGASSARLLVGPFGEKLQIRLVLAETELPDGHLVILSCAGGTSMVGSGAGGVHDINVVNKRTVARRIGPGAKYIAYVEGDRPCVLRNNMSLEEFCKENTGSHLVIEVDLKSTANF